MSGRDGERIVDVTLTPLQSDYDATSDEPQFDFDGCVKFDGSTAAPADDRGIYSKDCAVTSVTRRHHLDASIVTVGEPRHEVGLPASFSVHVLIVSPTAEHVRGMLQAVAKTEPGRSLGSSPRLGEYVCNVPAVRFIIDVAESSSAAAAVLGHKQRILELVDIAILDSGLAFIEHVAGLVAEQAPQAVTIGLAESRERLSPALATFCADVVPARPSADDLRQSLHRCMPRRYVEEPRLEHLPRTSPRPSPISHDIHRRYVEAALRPFVSWPERQAWQQQAAAGGKGLHTHANGSGTTGTCDGFGMDGHAGGGSGSRAGHSFARLAGSMRLLHVESDGASRAYTRSMFAELGVLVDEAASGEEALQMLAACGARRKYDLVLVAPHQLSTSGGMSGFALAQWYRAECAADGRVAALLVALGLGGADDCELCEDFGFDYYAIANPVSHVLVHALVEERLCMLRALGVSDLANGTQLHTPTLGSPQPSPALCAPSSFASSRASSRADRLEAVASSSQSSVSASPAHLATPLPSPAPPHARACASLHATAEPPPPAGELPPPPPAPAAAAPGASVHDDAFDDAASHHIAAARDAGDAGDAGGDKNGRSGRCSLESIGCVSSDEEETVGADVGVDIGARNGRGAQVAADGGRCSVAELALSLSASSLAASRSANGSRSSLCASQGAGLRRSGSSQVQLDLRGTLEGNGMRRRDSSRSGLDLLADEWERPESQGHGSQSPFAAMRRSGSSRCRLDSLAHELALLED